MGMERLSESDPTQTGDWTDFREVWFWDDKSPYDVRRAIEKLTAHVLVPEKKDEKLSYAGWSATLGVNRGLSLRFKAVLLTKQVYRNLFSLAIRTTAPKKWFKQEQFAKEVQQKFDYWAGRLEQCDPDLPWDTASSERYGRQVELSLAREHENDPSAEDIAATETIQRAVLDALRKGQTFRTAHHEGGTVLSFHDGSFWREDYGEDPAKHKYATDREMIRCLREFYDWESRRDIYPNKAPELEVWKYIQGKLYG